MSNKTIRRHELQTDKFIFPCGRWECWICRQPKTNMTLLDLSGDVDGSFQMMVTLVCVPCVVQLRRALIEADTIGNRD